MSRSPGGRRWFRGLVLPALGLLLTAGLAASLIRDNWFRPRISHRLTITGGKWSGPQQRSVELLRRLAAPSLVLTTSEVPGSMEALDRVHPGRVGRADRSAGAGLADRGGSPLECGRDEPVMTDG